MMANRIVNNPDYVVEDMLRGFVKLTPILWPLRKIRACSSMR